MNKSRKWISVFVPADTNAFESIHNILFEQGASGTEECEYGVRGYFPESTFTESVRLSLEKYLEELRTFDMSVGSPVCDSISEQDWGEKWREGFQPVRVTGRIIVKPPWEMWKSDSESVVIEIYPRMAFGTGTHETTQLCLMLAEKYLKPGWRVFDVGTGSGILAIAAAKLGAESVLGLDNDEDAIENAVENIGLNGVEKQVTVRLVNSEFRIPNSELFELVLANIDRPTLTSVIPKIKPVVHPQGMLILSGILDTEKEMIEEVLRQNKWHVFETVVKGEWVGLVCNPL